jgi:hypothetical protein
MGLFSAEDRAALMGRLQMAISEEHTREAFRDIIDKLDSISGLTAALTGNVTGNVNGRVTLSVSTPISDGAADMTKSFFTLGSGIDLTAFTPAAAGHFAIIWCTDSTVDATVTCGAGCTFDGTNNKATFADIGDALVLIALSSTRWLILLNIGAVALSSV